MSASETNNEKLMFFIHFQNFYTRNSDHDILLIKIGYAHKQRILPQTTINSLKGGRKGGLKHSQKNIAAKWWLFLQLLK